MGRSTGHRAVTRTAQIARRLGIRGPGASDVIGVWATKAQTHRRIWASAAIADLLGTPRATVCKATTLGSVGSIPLIGSSRARWLFESLGRNGARMGVMSWPLGRSDGKRVRNVSDPLFLDHGFERWSIAKCKTFIGRRVAPRRSVHAFRTARRPGARRARTPRARRSERHSGCGRLCDCESPIGLLSDCRDCTCASP